MGYIECSRAFGGRLNKRDFKESLYPASKILEKKLREEIRQNRIPFLTMNYLDDLDDLEALSKEAMRYNNMLLLGIGGSALGAKALQRAFAPSQDMPGHNGRSLWVADNVCSVTFEAWLSRLNPADTIVVTISKSGQTIETISQYFIVTRWLREALGDEWKDHMIIITDKNKGFLREEVATHGLRSMVVPDNLGGRFSALSPVGLLPAAYLGIDWKNLIQGARDVSRCLSGEPRLIRQHPAFYLACWAKTLEDLGYHELIFYCYEPLFASLGPWFAQLWAESLGKNGLGLMPVPAIGVTDQHSLNQMFLDGPRDKGCFFLTTEKRESWMKLPEDLPKEWEFLSGKLFASLLNAEALSTLMALVKNQVPVMSINLKNADERSCGKLMMLLEITTVLTGWLMGIDPTNQPAVELGKRLTAARLGCDEYDKEKTELSIFLLRAEERVDMF